MLIRLTYYPRCFISVEVWFKNQLQCIDILNLSESESLWNSLGQNTAVGSLSLLQGIFPKWSEVAQSCPTLYDPMDFRLLSPWDFPGKSAGVDCRFLLQKIFPTEGSNLGPPVLHADSLPVEPQGKPKTDSATPWTNIPGSSVHGDSSGKNAGVGCHALLQGIFPTQGLNPGLPHCRQTLLSSETPGKSESCQVVSNSFRPHGILQARILEWVPLPSPGDLPNPGIEPRSPALQVDSLPAEPQYLVFLPGESPWTEKPGGLDIYI